MKRLINVINPRSILLILLPLAVGIFAFGNFKSDAARLIVEMETSHGGYGQFFWDTGNGYNEAESQRFALKSTGHIETYAVSLPATEVKSIRIDPMDAPGLFKVKSVGLKNDSSEYIWSQEKLHHDLSILQNITKNESNSGNFIAVATTDDPSLEMKHLPRNIFEKPVKNRFLTSILYTAGSFGVILFFINLNSVVKIVSSNNRPLSIAITGCLFLIVLISKAGSIHLPYHWDESVYMTDIQWLTSNGLWRIFPGFHPQYVFFGHPPALFFSVATIHKVFGDRIWISHLFMIVFSFLGVYFTYLLAKHLFNRTTGILASLFLFSMPLYFAQSGMILSDVMVASLGIMSLYFALREKYGLYLLSSLYLVMTKETAAAIIFALLIFIYFTEKDRSAVRRKLITYAVPLIALCAFFLIQKISTGMFLPNIYFDQYAFFNLSLEPIKWVFYYQNRIFLTSLILLNLVVFGKAAWRKEFSLFFLIILFFTGTFSVVFFLPRYLLPTLPFLSIMAAYATTQLFKSIKLQVAVGCIILVLFTGKYYGKGEWCGSFEESMQYVDVISTHMEACKYLETNFPGKKVLTSWPLSDALSKPYLGFVTRPLTNVSHGEEFDIVLYTMQGHDAANKKLKELVETREMVLNKRFESNGKFVEVYFP